MWIIGSIILVMYFAGYLMAGIQFRKKSNKEKIRNPFYITAEWMEEKIAGRDREHKNCGRLREHLIKIHPGTDAGLLLRQYRVQKLEMMLMIIFAGTVISTAVSLQSGKNNRLEKGYELIRSGYDEDEDVTLIARVEGYEPQKIDVELTGKVPDKATADLLEAAFWEELKAAALSGNASWDSVEEDLELMDSLEDYPFTVTWISDAPHVTDSEGNVELPKDTESFVLQLSAIISYYEWEWIHTLEVTVTANESEEQMKQELERLVTEANEENLTEERVPLPDRWRGKTVQWNQKREDNGPILWLLSVVAGLAVYYLKDKDTEKMILERKRKMKEAYPVLVQKLTLYLGAGMNIRRAFMKMAHDYEETKINTGEIQPVYEELVCICREMNNGVPESSAYERFADRCELQEYTRLAALLSQNLYKGGNSLLNRLQEEAKQSQEEMLHRIRQLGDEANTKLLIPMTMLLGIVMVLIMIPAFAAF